MNIDHISLSSIYVKRKNDRDIFQELMPSKVKEILLIATKYDAYSIVREGQFSDKIFGEYLQLNLYSAPRFTSANTLEEALHTIKKRHFDMVIIMASTNREAPIETAKQINKHKSRLPILLLVNNNYDLGFFTKKCEPLHFIDRVFVWNGNTSIFLAMIKYIEDKKNVARDVKLGNVRVILLVEDSVKYYSRYLPLLYSSVMLQTQKLVSDDAVDELHKILKMRARPKILLVSNYEDATKVFDRYHDNLLCVISDVRFKKNGKDDDEAGVKLLEYVKQNKTFPIPLMMQSHDLENAKKAKESNAEFVHKNSESLSKELNDFIHRRLGFGNFEFQMPDGRKIAEAHSLSEFQELVARVPIESLLYHGDKNAFSRWLMARGEINIAEQLVPKKPEQFTEKESLRKFMLQVFEKIQNEQLRGRIVNFDPDLLDSNRYIIRLAKGSLGGKGRGLAFISNFIENIDFKKIIPNIDIRMPATAIIGALEFDTFIEINNLYQKVIVEQNHERVNDYFLKGKFSESLSQKLLLYLEKINRPLAVRSSGLFEDSLLQPFSGVYATYLLPNNHPDIQVRLNQLQNAIKLVYASTFDTEARSYFKAVNYKVEEEKMAVIIQEVVGRNFEEKFYSQVSGVAQSYNYYPVSYMQPEDGFSVTGVGLGMYIVGGEKSYRFCPKYPKINHNATKDQLRDSQNEYYALDMSQSNIDLSSGDEMSTIKKYKIRAGIDDQTLEHCASTFDLQNDMLVPGIPMKGPRVIDFANLLKYNTIPLADTLQLLLKIFMEAMGTPVEIEYAIDLGSPETGKLPTFYLLQLKPLIRKSNSINIDLNAIKKESTLLYANNGMGNGKVETIQDVIYVDPEGFDSTKTKEIVPELTKLNEAFMETGKKYLLIGPGRWGTKDHFTGIPVVWSQISSARVIIEMGLKDFQLDASLGSHFFHNVTSMNVGYYSVPYNSEKAFINFDLLKNAALISKGKYVKHVKLSAPLSIQMDGRKRAILIEKK